MNGCPCHGHNAFTDHRCTPLCSHSIPECVAAPPYPNPGKCEGRSARWNASVGHTSDRCTHGPVEWDQDAYAWLCPRHSAARRRARAKENK